MDYKRIGEMKQTSYIDSITIIVAYRHDNKSQTNSRCAVSSLNKCSPEMQCVTMDARTLLTKIGERC